MANEPERSWVCLLLECGEIQAIGSEVRVWIPQCSRRLTEPLKDAEIPKLQEKDMNQGRHWLFVSFAEITVLQEQCGIFKRSFRYILGCCECARTKLGKEKLALRQRKCTGTPDSQIDQWICMTPHHHAWNETRQDGSFARARSTSERTRTYAGPQSPGRCCKVQNTWGAVPKLSEDIYFPDRTLCQRTINISWVDVESIDSLVENRLHCAFRGSIMHGGGAQYRYT